jgi:hypothetical protein
MVFSEPVPSENLSRRIEETNQAMPEGDHEVPVEVDDDAADGMPRLPVSERGWPRGRIIQLNPLDPEEIVANLTLRVDLDDRPATQDRQYRHLMEMSKEIARLGHMARMNLDSRNRDLRNLMQNCWNCARIQGQ